MPRRLISGLLLPLVGFALGWWLRGVPNPVATQGTSSPSGEARERRIPAAEGGALSSKRSRRESVEAVSEADRRRELADRERMQATCRRKLELQVAEWRRELGLSDAEVAALHEAIGPAVGQAEPPVAELALPILVKNLEDMLDDGRAAAFGELAARKEEALLAARVDSKLAEIGAVLLLSPAQKEAIRQVLGPGADGLPEPGRPSPGLPPEALAEVSRRLASRNDDGSAFMEVAGEVLREQIEAELQTLGGILTPDQLESYRGHLEAARAGWLAPSP